jgi:V/A-type H+-transporting ATPase subunit E
MKTDKIRKAVLNKAKDDADKITSDAGLRASEVIEEAKDRRRQRFEKEKKMIIDEARREASKILAQASLKARQEILKQKNAVINEIISKVKNELQQAAPDKKSLLHIIKEVIDAFETEDSIRIFVSHKDAGDVSKIIEENRGLSEKITEVRETDCLGGILAEKTNGMVSIDNTFDTRLEMLMAKILPEIGRKLFGTGES